jgi:hypothetical protein
MARHSTEHSRRLLDTRLRERRGEIEAAIATRIHSDGAPTEAADPEYAEGLRAAVPAALDYCLASVARGEGRAPPLPTALLSQARLAARNNVSLDTVLRRYFAGYTLLGDFLVDEVQTAGLQKGADLKCLLRDLAASFDRLLAGVSEEHGRESANRYYSIAARQAKRVERLLAGELLDTADLDYDFEAHHLGVVAAGPEAADAVRKLARGLDCRLLLVPREQGTVWAWLGARHPIDPAGLGGDPGTTSTSQLCLAAGEPAQGLGGWRLTHRQAKAALPIAVRDPGKSVRYTDVALLASTLQDDLLAASLRQIYLAPLEAERDGGRVARETLRAYFAADRNVSSTAAALGVRRHTVASRLQSIEERVGRPLNRCASELDTALRLEELGVRILPPGTTITAM